MMEASSLTLAHDHARAASAATSSSDTTVAINEHTLAAGEFAKAAGGTNNTEALRTLRLLEQHHQRLSELLRYPSENPPTTASSEVQPLTEKPLSTSAAVAELRASKSDMGPRSSSPLRNPPSLQHPRRLPPRDLSSSIASNLASKRGIRANYTRQPLSPSVSNQPVSGNLESHPRRDGRRPTLQGSIPEHPTSQPSWVPPSQSLRGVESKSNSSRASTSVDPPADEGFSRFYSTFNSVLNKLSAPLAFAGLPLVAEEGATKSEPGSTSQNRKRAAHATENPMTEPDLSKYISRAALRASTRDGHPSNDSFYVVPTSGHTIPYAQILSFDQKERRRIASSMHSDAPELFAGPEEEDFFDARDTPMPQSPTLSRKSTYKRSSKQLENRVEELDMENQSLKGIVDKLSKRLSAFEMGAQSSSIALQQSMRLVRDQSPNPGDEALRKRVRALEEQAASDERTIARLGQDNDKLKETIAKYRSRWEKLKEGAKTRRAADGSSATKGSSSKEDASTVNQNSGTASGVAPAL